MAKVSVYNTVGEQVSELDLNAKLFGISEIDGNLVHQAVRAQLSNARKSTAHTKYRSEVSGGGKKPWKQKGTGRARAGSSRSPLWKGGGVTFGPRSNRNWELKVNKSAFRKAIATVLTDKVNEKKLAVMDKLDGITKTKELATQLTAFAKKAGLGKKLMVILGKHDSVIERAGQNLANTVVLPAAQLNIVDLMKYDLIVTKDALAVMEKMYLK